MKIGILIAYFLLTNISSMTAQNTLEWLRVLGGNKSDYASQIVTDEASNVYGIGHFQGTIANLVSNGHYDVVVFKYDPDGNLIWLQQLGGIGEDLGHDISLDGQGRLYIAGQCRDHFYYNNDSLITAGGSDAFVAQLDTNGTINWVKGIGSPSYEIVNSITCDALGNVYASGTFEDSLVVDNQSLISYGSPNNFILKIDDSANMLWHNSLSTFASNNMEDLALDDNGNLYLMGYFRDIVYGSLGQLLSKGHNDALLAKFSTTGQLLWWKGIGGTYIDYGFSLELSGAHIYMTGVYQDTVYFDTNRMLSDGEFDVFLAQYDLAGNNNWVTSIGGLDDAKAFDLKLSANGQIFIAGYYEGTAIFGQDSIQSKDPKHVPSDLFIAAYDSTGMISFFEGIGGSMSDYATGLAIQDSSVYLLGVYQDSVWFGSELSVSKSMTPDFFLLKYNQAYWTSNKQLLNPSFDARIYPQPMFGKRAMLAFELKQETPVEIFLYNIKGQLIKPLLAKTTLSGQQQLLINKNDLSAGVYFIGIHTATKRSILKLIITD